MSVTPEQFIAAEPVPGQGYRIFDRKAGCYVSDIQGYHFKEDAEKQAAAMNEAMKPEPGTWMAVRQTPAFAVALDIARQERRSYLHKQQARQALEGTMIEGAEGLIEDEASLDFFRGALGAYRNDNNVLWGAARMLAAMVDDDDELGALSVLRAELDRQDAGKVEDPYDRWKRAQTPRRAGQPVVCENTLNL